MKKPMDAIDQIREIVDQHSVVLFMKGSPKLPMCDHSARAAQALEAAGGEFKHINVLTQPEIRANLPRYSDWPTFPQLFINGELIGGCDITLELFERGELAAMMRDLLDDSQP